MPTYQLRARAAHKAPVPMLDLHQRAVVDHDAGPLLVLAGPGTGKTTTLVEAVVDRVERRGLAPERVLVLTFSRKAAGELHRRIAARLGRTTAGPAAYTFHSYCYGLVRRFSDPTLYTQPPALLSAPEHDLRLRELLRHSRDSGRVDWPHSVLPALATRGLAAELRALMARVRALGLDPDDVAAAGLAHDRPEWVAAGRFLAESLDVLDGQGMLDYAELVHRATVIVTDPEHRATLRRELAFVVVDEYQDTDPAQVALLHALAGDGRDLLVAGDPDQSIYGFRGADVRGLLDFADRFRTASGDPAPTRPLRTIRRFGPTLVRASRQVAHRLPAPGRLDAETVRAFRDPECAALPFSDAAGDGEGALQVRTFVSAAAEAESVAELLRRAHLDDGVGWSEMAVLVRSGVRSIPRLHRALAAAGVPVEVAGDELPLRAQPAVQTLLRALRLAHRLADGVPLPADDVEALLTSPVGGMGAAALRRLARTLHQRALGEQSQQPAPSSAELVARAVASPDGLSDLPGGEAARARRAALLLHRVAGQLGDEASVAQLLWEAWDGTGWPAILRRAVETGGPPAAAADRDLDAVCALFDLAQRADERQQRRSLGSFLDEVDAQQIPADPLAERAVRGGAVRLLTAHRSKGLEWRLVVVAGVQEDGWPGLRRRGSLLATDRLGADGVLPALLPAGPSTSTLLAEERRLFYVAVTRARERLVVTAVSSAQDSGEQPSRFLDELGVDAGPPEARPRRPLSLHGLLGELRARAEATDDPAVRASLARRIARLATSGLVPAADPDRWWGLREPTDAPAPVRPADRPVALSASAVHAIDECALRWFLQREAGGASPGTAAQGFGAVVHALAAGVADGDLPADQAAVRDELDLVWDRLPFPVSWASSAERAEASAALGRFLDWHRADRGRTALAAELEFDVTVPVGADTARLRGSIDRVELDRDGAVVVVDLKTGRTAPARAAVERHAQLGVYQLAVEAGATTEVAGGSGRPGGAELVQLRHQRRAGVHVQHQPADVTGRTAATQLAHAVAVVRGERFAATPGPACAHCEFTPVCPAQPAGRTLLDRSHDDTEQS